MSDTIEISGDDILSMLTENVTKDYGGEIVDQWLEREDGTDNIWAAFVLKDKIGIVKIQIGTGGTIPVDGEKVVAE